MPLPTPSKGEKQGDFISRCMSNENIQKEFGKGSKQAQAVCFSTWRKSKQKMNLKFNYQVPIIESAFVNDDFIITGTALNATVTSNNHKFIPEELKKSANTLDGVPLLIDHRNEVEAIKGRILSGEYDEAESKVNFRAHIIDNTMKGMIKDGRINSVSVGAAVEELEETDDGFFIPRGIEFKELSLVAVPADNGATFTIALQEAYETAVEKEVIIEYSNAEEVKKAMKKFNENKFKSNEERTAERLKIINAGRKFKVDTTEFEKATSTQTEAKDNTHVKLNKSGGKTMESEDTNQETKKQLKNDEEVTKETSEESKNEVTEEKLQKMITDAVEKAVKVKSADNDESPKKSEEESEKKSEETEEESEEEDSEETETTEEKGKYKIVQSYGSLKGGSFTLVRA